MPPVHPMRRSSVVLEDVPRAVATAGVEAGEANARKHTRASFRYPKYAPVVCSHAWVGRTSLPSIAHHFHAQSVHSSSTNYHRSGRLLGGTRKVNLAMPCQELVAAARIGRGGSVVSTAAKCVPRTYSYVFAYLLGLVIYCYFTMVDTMVIPAVN